MVLLWKKLIQDFQQRHNISYIYVTHSINSGFVTYYKGKSTNNETTSHKYISVYQDEVESWRKLLKVHDETTLSVAFTWCHDNKLCLARIFPDFFACDTIFGVTKE